MFFSLKAKPSGLQRPGLDPQKFHLLILVLFTCLAKLAKVYPLLPNLHAPCFRT